MVDTWNDHHVNEAEQFHRDESKPKPFAASAVATVSVDMEQLLVTEHLPVLHKYLNGHDDDHHNYVS